MWKEESYSPAWWPRTYHCHSLTAAKGYLVLRYLPSLLQSSQTEICSGLECGLVSIKLAAAAFQVANSTGRQAISRLYNLCSARLPQGSHAKYVMPSCREGEHIHEHAQNSNPPRVKYLKFLLAFLDLLPTMLSRLTLGRLQTLPLTRSIINMNP